MSLYKQHTHKRQWRYSFTRPTLVPDVYVSYRQAVQWRQPATAAQRRTAPRDQAATKYLPQRSLMRPNYHNWNYSTCSKIPSSPPSMGIIFMACNTVALFEVAQLPQRTAIVSLNTVSQVAFLVQKLCACWQLLTEYETSLHISQTLYKEWHPVLF